MAEKTEENPAVTVLALLALPLEVCLHGYVAMRLWNWHVVPVFHAPQLAIGHAVGLSVLLGFMRTRLSAPTNNKSTANLLVLSVMVSGLTLLAGWLAT